METLKPRNHIRIGVVRQSILQEQKAECNPSVTGDFSLALRRVRNQAGDIDNHSVHVALHAKTCPKYDSLEGFANAGLVNFVLNQTRVTASLRQELLTQDGEDFASRGPAKKS